MFVYGKFDINHWSAINYTANAKKSALYVMVYIFIKTNVADLSVVQQLMLKLVQG